ncbi:MAG: hypothetical protein NTZ50_12065 [Chloroflexi bacterium]|nr:hypothetical protein [Chloroflexota bacterium]
MGAFRVFGRALRGIWDDVLPLGVMNLLTILCQITVVLGPPSMAALHAMCQRAVDGYAIKTEEYFRAMRQYFVRAWIFALPALVVNTLIVWNIAFYAGFQQEWAIWVQGAWLAALLFWNAIQFYMFPFLVAQEDKHWRVALRNSVITAGANPLFTLILLILCGLMLGLAVATGPVFFFLGLVVVTMPANAAVLDRVADFQRRHEEATARAQERTR